MAKKHAFESFLDRFIPEVAAKIRQVNKAYWILETTGSSDAADLKAELDTECRLLFHSKTTFSNLVKWDKEPSIKDPLVKRQLNVLIRAFKQNQIPKSLVTEISQKEAGLAHNGEYKMKYDREGHSISFLVANTKCELEGECKPSVFFPLNIF